jgi:4-carboxymuconolactone decarboxylase
MGKTTPLASGPQRMPSVTREEWTDEVRDVFAVFDGEEGRLNGSKYNFAHWFANHPQLAKNWLVYNRDLSRGVLDPVLRELVVMRVAHLYKSEYEWNLHVQISTHLGIGEAQLEAVKEGPDAQLWSDDQRLCLRVADQLCEKNDIDDELWNALAARFSRKEMMELLFLVGSYTLLAWVLKAVRMPLEDL